jgi:hypothetical protein
MRNPASKPHLFWPQKARNAEPRTFPNRCRHPGLSKRFVVVRRVEKKLPVWYNFHYHQLALSGNTFNNLK